MSDEKTEPLSTAAAAAAAAEDKPTTMAELGEEDKYEEYNYDADKYMPGGGRGKGRTRKEAEEHTNRTDPGGHTRKTTQKLINSHEKEKEQQLKATAASDKHHHHHHKQDNASASDGPEGEGTK